MQFDKETQVRILRVASDRQQGREVEELDDRISYVMDLHPEFEEIWTMGDMAAYPQEINGQIVSPFVHTVLHTIVDSQIRTEQPEFVVKTLNRLLGQGLEEHEALHAIIASFADIHFASFRQGKPFDQLDYQSRLGYLSYEDKEEK
ncbi:MAG: DUF1841 family protein [Nitrospina sp.]|jgi:hypothetical protein|nr:DUF1841 family protein [Nitrospina sp.]MBT3415878.1 DUF1841 family protein [Nitrospina sp.]MBT3856266.1 DUF1841 family protein [Nitrospina sp.]MBT4104299.1 DUF1841 family protein [Nitrospina sp.]MBT4389720.1 DUF1841 family protein [Nitrospina sp.]